MGRRLHLSRSLAFVSGLTLSLIAGLLTGLPPAAATVAEPDGPAGDRSVPVTEVPQPGTELEQKFPVDPPRQVVWPKPGVAVVDLPSVGERGLHAAGSVVVGGLPVRVSPVVGAGGDFVSKFRAPGAVAPGRVLVEVLDRAVASRVGAAVAVRVSRADGVVGAAKVRVELDYSAFRYAFGADWAWRLGLATVPRCSFAETVGEDCVGFRRLASSNDAKAGVISAEVPMSSSENQTASGHVESATEEPVTVALVAAGSGTESGDFTKTDLKETSSWAVGLQSGDFTWSYPMRVPPVPGGLVPRVGLSYSSGAVDGQTAGRHTQPSNIGEGWSYSPGFIERTYRPCSDDSANSPYWTALNYTADMCWRLPNAQIMLNGRSSEIVLGDDGTWRFEDDNGEKVELLTGAPNSDDLDNGEHWKITTTDGTQYWFGRDTLPNGKGSTNSVLTMPVFANHSGEPCFSTSSAASSRCAKQAYRWMLDYVVDRNGNEMSYWYSRYTNRSGLAGNSSSTTAYHRDVVLSRIEYGTHTSDPATVVAPARVSFSYADRCLTASCGTKDETNWPDTPWDLQCDLSPCGNNMSPSFWSHRRLAAVYSQVLVNGSYSTVDYWSLDHEFPSTGDGSSPVLWLGSITQTGKAGDSPEVDVPPVSFWGVRKQNRVDYDPDAAMLSHNKWRVYKVLTESGRQVEVTYAPDDPGCHLHAPFPDPAQNPKRCFPQYYAPDPAPPGFAWWHKRIVTKVVESDATGSSTAPITHEYQYGLSATDTTVLWAYDASARVWSSPAGKRSWSDWRGYTNVTVRTGPPGGLRSQTEYVYFRGLHGDRTDGANRSVTLSAYSGTWSDQAQRRGHLMNKTVYSQSGGAPAQIMQYNPWTHVTGTRVLSSDWAVPGTFKSQINRTDGVARWEVNDSGTMSWRAGVEDAFDTFGRITKRHDKGNAGVADSTCTRFGYAENPAKHMLAFKNREQTVKGTCDDPYTIPDDLVFDHAWRYDGGGYDAAPTLGNVSKDYVYRDTAWVDIARDVTYDKYGRVTSSADALVHTTTTAYTENSDHLTTTVKVTNALGHVASTTLDVSRGSPLSVTDVNGKVTTGTYDALGRLLSVTRPGNTTGLPDVDYYYYLARSSRSFVRTRTLGPNGHQISSYEIYDGMLRPRQAQIVAPDWNRVISDVQYDERGLAVKNTTFYNGDSGPTATLAAFSDANVDQQIRTVYDGRGRVTDTELWSRNAYQWETTTSYGLNWRAVMPPVGGTATKDLFDDKGNLVEKWQYHARDFSASSDKTKYGYNLRNQLTSVTDPAGNQWTYEYNLLGWKTKTTDPDAGISTFTYDSAGQLQTSTDARGVTLDYNYDTLGRKTSLYQGTTKLASWSYDTVAKGQLYGSYRWEGGLAYSNTVLAVDEAYRPTSMRTTIPATAANGALAGDYDVSMTYKVNGALASQTLPSVGGLPGETISYTYGNHGFADTITSTWAGGGSQTYVADTQHTFDGLISQQLLGNPGKQVKLTNTFDAATRRADISYIATESQSNPGTWWGRYSTEYEHDPAGNITSIAGVTLSNLDQVECFQYDHLRRLSTAWTQAARGCTTPQRTGADPYWREWTFDTIGNRLTQVDKDPAGDTTWTYQVGTAAGVKPHQLKQVDAVGPEAGTPTRSFGYDTAGNTTTATTATGANQTLTWDAEGHLASVTEGANTTSYLYDANGRRLIARAPDKTTLYLPDGTELELSAGGGPILGTRYYSAAVRDATGLKWVASNHQGTSLIQIDAVTLASARRRMMPYGEDRGTQPSEWMGTKGYVGGTKDETGYTHLGAREYDPSLGRFISRDLIVDFTDPQQVHGYAYSHNSPITFSDPTGLRDTCDTEGNVTCSSPTPNPAPPTPPVNPPPGSCPSHPACDAVDGADDGLTVVGALTGAVAAWEQSRRENAINMRSHPDREVQKQAAARNSGLAKLKAKHPQLHGVLKWLATIGKMSWFKTLVKRLPYIGLAIDVLGAYLEGADIGEALMKGVVEMLVGAAVGAAIGALAGTLCGPGAPVCSTLAAIAGAFVGAIAGEAAVWALFENPGPRTTMALGEPCMNFDGCPTKAGGSDNEM